MSYSIKGFNRRGGFTVRNSPHRSGLEERLAKQLKDAKCHAAYEEHTINYQVPASNHRYTPDFVLPNGIIVEAKGIFDSDDRKKHLLIKKQYPNLEIRFVFSNPNSRLYKGSKTTYGQWCTKNGYTFTKGVIPSAWILDKTKYNTEGLHKKEVKK